MLLIYRLSLFIFFIFNFLILFGQKNADIGFAVGGTYYQGDLNSSKLLSNPRIAGGILFRYNFSSRYSLRGSFFLGGLAGNDANSGYLYQQQRNMSFSSTLYELTAQVEFNFMEFVSGDDEKYYFTPYVASGFTFFMTDNYRPALPFGVGVKYNLTQKISIGGEWSYRKTFSDLVDGTTGMNSDAVDEYNGDYHDILFKQNGYYHQKDYYALINVFITFKINTKGEAVCPAYWSNYGYKR